MYIDPAGQLDEVGDRKLLGAPREEGVLGPAEIAERRAQRVADHLAALPERGLHDADEEPLVAVEPHGGVASQPHDGALDLGRRVEDRLVDREEVLDVVPRLQQHREDAVLLRSGPLGQPHGDLLLDHAHALGHEVTVFEHLEEDLRRDVVGEVADDLQPLRKERPQVELQEVPLDEPGRELRVVRMEVGDALRVDLGTPRHDVAAPQQKLRQHPHAAPHLQHGGRIGQHGRRSRRRCPATEGVADLARDVQVDQKMLSQRLFCSDFTHRCRKDSAKRPSRQIYPAANLPAAATDRLADSSPTEKRGAEPAAPHPATDGRCSVTSAGWVPCSICRRSSRHGRPWPRR